MPLALNKSQIEILKMLEYMKDERDLAEIKSLLVAYLSYKVVREADKAFNEKKYTREIFEAWKKDHFRKSA